MKKALLVIVSLGISMMLQAQVSKTVLVTNAGKLTTLLTPTEKSTVTNLTVSGVINACYFVTMRDNMPNLAVINLSQAIIEGYNGTLGTQGNSSSIHYNAQTIPQQVFL